MRGDRCSGSHTARHTRRAPDTARLHFSVRGGGSSRTCVAFVPSGILATRRAVRSDEDRATGRAQPLGFGTSCSGFQGIFETPGPAVAGSPGVSRGSSVLYALRRNLGERGAPNVRHRERTPERR